MSSHTLSHNQHCSAYNWLGVNGDKLFKWFPREIIDLAQHDSFIRYANANCWRSRLDINYYYYDFGFQKLCTKWKFIVINAVNKFIFGFVENICAIICIYNAAFAISTKAIHFCHKLTIRCTVFASLHGILTNSY